MAQWVKMLDTKPDHTSSSLEATLWRELTPEGVLELLYIIMSHVPSPSRCTSKPVENVLLATRSDQPEIQRPPEKQSSL